MNNAISPNLDGFAENDRFSNLAYKITQSNPENDSSSEFGTEEEDLDIFGMRVSKFADATLAVHAQKSKNDYGDFGARINSQRCQFA